MGVVFTNNAETTLAAAITSTSATSISVTSSSTFPTVGAGEYFYATIDDGTNNEIVKITAVSGTTWTVVRAQDDTTARTFANGSTIQLRTTAALLTDIQENIASKSANQTVYNATAASSATAYDVGINPGVEANAMVFLDGVMQHHDTFSFSGSTLTFDAAPVNGTKIEVIVDNLINLQSSNLTVDTFTATSNQTAFTLSDSPAAESNLIVFINGVFQNQAAYTISNNTLTLDTGVVSGRTVTVYVINPVNIGTPSDGTVTSAKLSGNITTPGTLTVGSHDVAFDSPTFVVDNANSRVGLGTASPSVPVDIVGEVKTSSHINIGGNLVKASGDLTIDAQGNDTDIIFKGTDNSSDITALTLDMSAAGAATFNDLVDAKNFKINGGQGSDGQVLTSTGSGVAWEDAAGGSSTSISDADSDTKVQVEESSDEDKIRFDTAGTERMIIDNSGNLGFNTTDVTVGSSVSGSSTATPKFITYNNDYSSGYTDASLKLYLFNSGTTRQGFTSGPAYDLQYHSSGSDAGRHAFHVANTEIMRINKTQVGIGDSSVIASNTTSTLAVRKDNSAGRGGEISIVNYAATAVGNEAALNFGLESSTYDSDNGNFQIKARVMGSDAATDAIFSQWSGSAFKQRMRLKSNGTFYISEDLGAHTGVYSFDHNTYQHAAVFGANSTPNGSVVIEDYDVSSGIGNTVLRLYLRDEDPATNAVFIDFADGGGRVGSVTHNDDGGGVSFNTTSDYRLKENVNYDWEAIPLLKQLKPAKFNFKRNPAKTIQGMLAHEVADIVPSSVRGNKDHMEPIGTIKDSDGNIVYEGVYEHFTKTDKGQTWTKTGTEPIYQELDYSRLVPLLSKALQEQQTIIEDLKSRIETLEG